MEKRRYIAIIVILISLFYLTGCSSIGYRTKKFCPSISPRPYPGVRCLLNDVKTGCGYLDESPMFVILSRFLAILDFPLSFALDTICLPYDIFQTEKGDKKQGKENNIKSESERPIVNVREIEQIGDSR